MLITEHVDDNDKC